MLKFVTHFFVQNQESVLLLKNIHIDKVSLSGDTRFDRVYENAQHPKKLELIEKFCGNSPVFIAGSTWLTDEKLLVSLPEQYPDWKFIIAPHEIGWSHLLEIERLFPKAVKYSNFQCSAFNLQPSIIIIDNIGMLSSLYQYAKVAYIGGGFGAGIHNTLEAAAFGLPVIFGPKYEKFQEAINAFEHFKLNEKASANAKKYVEQKKGATQMIIEKIACS
jgi:3-deoxy-D-manno-octulosonic-acid transferase